jgi:excisionase family DNA binding protein
MNNGHREITAIEAAKKLGIRLDYLYSLIWIGRLAARKDGRKWRVSASSVEARLKQLGDQCG